MILRILVALGGLYGLGLAQKCGSVRRRGALLTGLKCLGKRVGPSFAALEAEFRTDTERRLRRCFVREGRGVCGRPAEILAQNIFGPDSAFRRDCPLCGRNIDSTLENYLNHPQRSCMSQVFMDEVSLRLRPCTNGRLISFADADGAASEHPEELRKSIALGVAWRQSLDDCSLEGNGKAAKRIQRCMRRRKPQCSFCRLYTECLAEGPCERYTPVVAAKACRCFLTNQEPLMAALKGMADKVAERQAAKGVKDWDAVQDCQKLLRSHLDSIQAYGEGRYEIDWLGVYAKAVEKCTGTKIPAYEGNIDWACAMTQLEFQPPPDSDKSSVGGARTLQKVLYYVANFAQALMDRASKFCSCSRRSAAVCSQPS